jgi:hypothetical protein
MSSNAYQPQGYCPNCNYPIDPGICPECGLAVTDQIIVRDRPDERISNPYRMIEVGALMTGAIVTAGGLLYIADWSAGVSAMIFLFAGWVMLPYVVFYKITTALYRRRFSPGLPLCAGISAILMVVIPFYLYADAMFLNNTSSTSALVFIFIPPWLLIGGPMFLFTLLGFERLVTYLTKE